MAAHVLDQHEPLRDDSQRHAGYDSNGNLTSDGFHKYSWDADGNMATLDTGNGLTYDAMDRRVEQTVSGTNTEILYGPGGTKLALLSGQTIKKLFLPLPGGGTAVYTPSGLTYYRHPDWLGSSRLASTPSRTVYYDGTYAPFGETNSTQEIRRRRPQLHRPESGHGPRPR